MRLLLLVALSLPAIAVAQLDPLLDVRRCGPPARDESGEIIRSSKVRYRFKVNEPCPAGYKAYEACPGWQIDHVIPLVCGGCDSVSNMQWLPTDLKRFKDALEQGVYCR